MNYEEKTSKYSGWWRWLLLPFAAIIGGSIGAIIITRSYWLALEIQGFSADSWILLYMPPVFSSAVFGWLYVLITLNVVPKWRVIAAIVMTTILGVVLLTGSVLVWLNPNEALGATIQVIVSSIVTMVSAIASIENYKDEYKD